MKNLLVLILVCLMCATVAQAQDIQSIGKDRKAIKKDVRKRDRKYKKLRVDMAADGTDIEWYQAGDKNLENAMIGFGFRNDVCVTTLTALADSTSLLKMQTKLNARNVQADEDVWDSKDGKFRTNITTSPGQCYVITRRRKE
ncbi:hypothetical protein SAMN00120144_3679 [Hymenobacter roseosalivarius DSM 11622]|uniref:Uncharacterized protein n=1 Tax=Hymenobacter roseosalivarius DSM 11622 TaxID=645990 RepID=A0A1W1W095_9BACT|nr:hypothetical protein [Hymenobacter roseosalivarius]SMB99039.1 hypothetical protein SAMN00120144_3679 [Hymenobacter roseosalivarius DSM 11622]